MSLDSLKSVIVAMAMLYPASVSAQGGFPNLEVLGASWSVELGDLAPEADADSVSYILRPPLSVKFENTDQVISGFIQACKEITSNPEFFAAGNVDPNNISSIFMVLEVVGQKILPYYMRHRVESGACSGKIGFEMPTLEDPFSTHDPKEELFAVFNSWGLGAPESHFKITTGGRYIETEIELLPNFKRDISDLNALAMCIHAIANFEKKMNIFLLTFKPENYSEMEIQIIERLPDDNGSLRRVLGAVKFGLKGGKCLPQGEKS